MEQLEQMVREKKYMGLKGKDIIYDPKEMDIGMVGGRAVLVPKYLKEDLYD